VTLFIDEASVSELLSVEESFRLVSQAFAAYGRGSIINMPRQRLRHGEETVRITAALDEDEGYLGVKVSSSVVFGRDVGRTLTLHELSTGRMCAVIQVFHLGGLRTGAVSGVATEFLARSDAEVVGVIGTGRQARTQVAAIRRVRAVRRVQVYGRNHRNRDLFLDSLRSPDLEVIACETARQSTEGADIVVTATSATTPVLLGEWLSPGMHINAIGANLESRRELDSAVITRSDLIAVDEIAQSRYEATDLVQPLAEGLLDWDEIRSLGSIVAGLEDGRKSSDDISLFKSVGTAIGDIQMAVQVYKRALERGLGMNLPDLAGVLP